jgi:hypothetical protein
MTADFYFPVAPSHRFFLSRESQQIGTWRLSIDVVEMNARRQLMMG